jgi:hypothetical protein
MDPAAVFPDVGHLKEIGIQSCIRYALSKGRLMHKWSAGSYHYPVQVVFLNMLLYLLLARLSTGIPVQDGNLHIRKRFSIFPDLLAIQRTGDIKATLTYKYTDS